MKAASKRYWRAGIRAAAAALVVAGCDGEVTSSGGGAGNGASSGSAGNGASSGSGGAGATGGQGGAGATGGTFTTGTGTIVEGSFPCGESSCAKATQYCLTENGGPCCGPAGHKCVDLPAVCAAAGADCECFKQTDCPCGGAGPCMDNGSGIGTSCDGSYEDGLTFVCSYP